MPLVILLAAVLAFLLMTTLHWGTQVALHGRMGLLWRYISGTAAIGIVFAGWCAMQPSTITPLDAWLAWAAIAAGAGLGTIAGHGLDHLAAKERELRLLRRKNDVEKSE